MNKKHHLVRIKTPSAWVVVSELAWCHLSQARAPRIETTHRAPIGMTLRAQLPRLGAMAVALCAIGVAHAATPTWTGTTSTDWSTATNWSTGVVPASSDTVFINSNSPQATVLGISSTASGASNNVYVGGASGSTGSLTIQNGSTLTSAGSGHIGEVSGATGTATVTGASTWAMSGVNGLIVGNLGTGTLSISSGSRVTSAGAIGIGSTGTGTVVVDGSGSSFGSSSPSPVVVGSSGNGAVTVSNSGAISSAGFILGANGTGMGTVTVSGPGSTWASSSNWSYVGYAGHGALSITNGGRVTNAGWLWLGFQSASTGSITVDGTGSQLTVMNPFLVGQDGVGHLVISNGGTVDTTGNIEIGRGLGSGGSNVVISGNSTLNTTYNHSTGLIWIGAAGAASFTAQSGATVITDLMVVGPSTIPGTATFTGSGTSVTVARGLLVGLDVGTGIATVSNGAQVKTGGGVNIGWVETQFRSRGDSPTGTFTVTGSGSTLATTAQLLTGSSGTGTLTVANKGTVSAASAIIGELAGATGTVVVTDSGSSLTSTGELDVGKAGTGKLTVQNSATLTSGSAVLGGASTGAGTVTLVGIGSSMTNSGTIVIGAAGAGTLNVNSGAVLTTGTASIGDAATGGGVVNVDGVGTTWVDTGDPIVGNAGTGTLNITHGATLTSTVSVLGNQSSGNGTATVDGAGSTWTDNGTITVGNAGTGVLNITNGSRVTAKGGVAVGVQSGSSGMLNLSGGGELQTLALTGGSGTRQANFNNAKLTALANQGAFVSGFNSGQLNIQSGGLTIDNAGFTVTAASPFGGSGALTTKGVGTLISTADNTYTGGTTIESGTLAVGDAGHASAALSGGGPTTVAAGATLGGYGSVKGTVTNNGTVAVANALAVFGSGANGNFTVNGMLLNSGLAQVGGIGIGNTLTATNYVGGSGSTLALNTYLGTDGSPSDKLIVNGGKATGSSGLTIANVGGAGALTTGNGIEVVEAMNGGTTVAGAFKLSRPVIAGPYEYTLYRGSADGSDTQSWYLRSTAWLANGKVSVGGQLVPNYRQEVSLYAALPSMVQIYGRELLGTLHERVGEQEQLSCGCSATAGRDFANGVWGRIVAQHGEQGIGSTLYTGGPRFGYDMSAVQIGGDLYRHQNEDGQRNHAGLYGAVGYFSGKVQTYTGADAGRNSFGAYSAGVYATHYGVSGWYVDGVAQATLYNNVKARSSRNLVSSSTVDVGLSTHGTGIAGSVEFGYPLVLTERWTIEPQAQLIYEHTSLANASDVAAKVQFPSGESMAGRLGARFGTTRELSGGYAPRLFTAWMDANLWEEFMGNNGTQVSSASGYVPFHSDIGGAWAEIGGGMTAQLSKHASVYAHAGYQHGLNGDRRGYTGNVGIRGNW